jgi:hypothetical protein
MRSTKTLFLGACAVAGTLTTLNAAAHHGWSGNNQPLELSGTVVSTVDLSGPHATMQIRDGDGQVWNVTLAPAPRTARAGLEEDTIPVGAQVTVSGMRNDDQAKFEIKTRRVTYDGKNYDVYPAS